MLIAALVLSTVTQITIHREAQCGGYYTPPDSQSTGPAFPTGACAGYMLILRDDGTAEYRGESNVPWQGAYTGTFDPAVFAQLACIADEIGFEAMHDAPRPAMATLDGDGPVTVTVGAKSVRHDSGEAPPSLIAFEAEIDGVWDRVAWNVK